MRPPKQTTLEVVTITAVALLTLVISSSANAHHANFAYDREQAISVSGTVTKWQFINPHCGIWVEVEQEDGSLVEWAGEFQSVQDLYRFFGWNKNTFQLGDEVTIIGNPDRRVGHFSMWVSEVVFNDGIRTDVRNTP